MSAAILSGDAAKPGDSLVFLIRLLTALVQALALYLLTSATTAPLAWPATEPRLFVPLLLVFSFIPLLLMLGAGQIRAGPLALWLAVAVIIVAALGFHDATRGRVAAFATEEIFWPSWRLWLAVTSGLFVAQVLAIDSIVECRFLPPYPRHFDTAWKQAVQTILAAAFTGVFWGVLHLGAGLFKLVDIAFFQRLIEHRWFFFPATTLALAVAIHVTDVNPALIRGARSLALTLLSWLLPMLALILLGFLASLPFLSVAALWRTHFAGYLLLTAAALIVLFVNTAYQDGAAERTGSRIKRLAGTVASLELIPLVGLAVWALSLRVGQYGWTVGRIFAAAIILLAACYTLGYAAAAIRSPSWLKGIEITNFVAAYLFLFLILALFSSIADPARLMVADQMARLNSGAVQPALFDFKALKFDGGRWGAEALTALSQRRDGADAETISNEAKRALAATSRYGAPPSVPVTPATIAERVTILPEGRALSADVIAGLQTWTGFTAPACLRTGEKCVVRFVTLSQGKPEAMLFINGTMGSWVFTQDDAGKWTRTARLSSMFCAAIRRAVESGDFTLEPHVLPDLVIGDLRLPLEPADQTCPRP